MCCNGVGKKIEDGSVTQAFEKLTLFILYVCYLQSAVWQWQMMCSNDVGRKTEEDGVTQACEKYHCWYCTVVTYRLQCGRDR